MDLLEAIRTRRSVRKFTSQPVDKATIEQLLSWATQAPSAMNSQPWAFGVIQGADRLRQLSDSTKAHLLANIDTYTWLERYRQLLSSPDFDIFYGASTIVTVLTRPTGPCPDTDCAMAAQTLMLAAHSLGLGTCWIGFASFLLNSPELKAELGIPADFTVLAPLALGYPAGEMPAPEKAAPQVVFWK